MKYVIEIDDKTKNGKLAYELLETLSDKKSGIRFIDEVEDNELLQMMKKSRKSGRAKEASVIKNLRKTAAK
ncbi:MAG: hypothetical protein IT247_01585 [Bacteroidia bacterium]|nr:hypothetical protein [Bacteroidia bacterium]